MGATRAFAPPPRVARSRWNRTPPNIRTRYDRAPRALTPSSRRRRRRNALAARNLRGGAAPGGAGGGANPRRVDRRHHPRVVPRVVVRLHRPQSRQRHVRVRRERRGLVRALPRVRALPERVPSRRERVPRRGHDPRRSPDPRRFRREEFEDPRLGRRDAIGRADDDARLRPRSPPSRGPATATSRQWRL